MSLNYLNNLQTPLCAEGDASFQALKVTIFLVKMSIKQTIL